MKIEIKMKELLLMILAAALGTFSVLVANIFLFNFDYSVIPIAIIFYCLGGLLFNEIYEFIKDKEL